jgi:8-oxo-dGTP pyrophosphatase MutT (NUDIX family)
MIVKEGLWKSSALTPIYALTPFPKRVVKSIFLAGPTVRAAGAPSWRIDALKLLEKLGFDGHVFIPEAADGVWKNDYDGQVEWEEEGLNRADVILFWVPRDLTGDTYGTPMPAFTTNDEWGHWKESGKVVWASPQWAVKTSYQKYYAKKLGVPSEETLEDGLKAALAIIGEGAEREGGETQVPLHVWRKKEFQNWLTLQKAAGNRLDGAKVLWGFFPRPGAMFCYAVRVNVYVASEDRNKSNELFLARPDTSSVLLYSWSEIVEIVLVREFRSTVRNQAGFVFELPSGSSVNELENPLGVAATEVQEETGLVLEPNRFERHESRQVAATFTIHKSTLFSCKLTAEEMGKLKADRDRHGNFVTDSEMTYIAVQTLDQIREEGLVDWVTLGMICSVLL